MSAYSTQMETELDLCTMVSVPWYIELEGNMLVCLYLASSLANRSFNIMLLPLSTMTTFIPSEVESSHDVKTLVLVDMMQDFAVVDAEATNNKAEEVVKYLDVRYPLKACQCNDANACNDADGELVNQGDEVKICVFFSRDEENNALPPAYVSIVDIESFMCTLEASSLMHMPINSFEFAGDGLTSVNVDNSDPSTEEGRMVVISTRLPSEFFGPESSAALCSGVIRYEFITGDNIFARRRHRHVRRVLAESVLPSIGSGFDVSTTTSGNTAAVVDSDSEFSVEVGLAGEINAQHYGDVVGRGVVFGSLVMIGAIVMLVVARPGGYSELRRRFIAADFHVGGKIALPNSSTSHRKVRAFPAIVWQPETSTSMANGTVERLVERQIKEPNGRGIENYSS